MAGILMAYMDGILREASLSEPVATELHLLSGVLLQIYGLQGQALGRSLASLIVARRQLWLSQARVPDTDKAACKTRRYPRGILLASRGGDLAAIPPRPRGFSASGHATPSPRSGVGQVEPLAGSSGVDYHQDGYGSHDSAG
ncbi:UNVERIFIED_CONTAM: hypothetical protein FKN15_033201 [Acipenser sinensis]